MPSLPCCPLLPFSHPTRQARGRGQKGRPPSLSSPSPSSASSPPPPARPHVSRRSPRRRRPPQPSPVPVGERGAGYSRCSTGRTDEEQYCRERARGPPWRGSWWAGTSPSSPRHPHTTAVDPQILSTHGTTIKFWDISWLQVFKSRRSFNKGWMRVVIC